MNHQIQFSAEDIQIWAELVGDYNPIHFNVDLARDRGLDGVVAHGMLSLLHLKHAVGLVMDPPTAEHTWVTVKARFRKPVLRAVKHQIEVWPAGPRGRFALTRSIDGLVTIDGTVHWAAEGPESAQPWKTFAVPANEFEKVLNRYLEGFPGMDGAWLALDCLLFENLLQNEIPFQLSKELGLAEGCESQAQLMRAALTVQSSQCLHVRSDLMKRSLDDLHQLLPLRCAVLPPTISAPDTSHGFVASCQMQLYSQQSLVLQSDVGLIVRPIRENS
ncbi:hypothetical protein BGV71_10545 [Burkholderia ubonensis]|uniref:MaoC family dehydratase n=1 Tax=Burkholderia ubonensis TaxID=101571 RepID=UPI0007555585|nr:MaoC family dehydratase [Burkholderia ubonensis]KVC86740.1 hypothetical protein WI76_04505 [Burkholderia ubonensis]KVZ28686.1 hypothetical protein WL13_32910 [Burkholderia ubonensis]KWB34815.1 hypothetical protein WL33_19670 [Burkholderia ubonensis]KWC26454.1 hypothetical protein WL50_07600 [Burkholderia ubonensis]OJA86265.1 hypothetical protein BGV71_10545 [Burkholderia ubonensis]